MSTELNNVIAIFCPEVTLSPKYMFRVLIFPYLVIGILLKALEYILITVYTNCMKKIEQILLLIAGSIVIIVIFGTAIAFISGSAKPGKSLRKEDPSPTVLTKKSDDSTSVYSQIGLLRCSTADTPSIPVVVNPYFPYPTADTAFYEELFKKNQKLRYIFTNYFETYTQQELLAAGEDVIKKALIERINAELVLGKIDELYFSEYIFLE